MWQTSCISMKLHTNLCNIVFFTVALPLVKNPATVLLLSATIFKKQFFEKLPTTNSNNFIFTTLKGYKSAWNMARGIIINPGKLCLDFFTGGCEGLCAHKKLLFWHIRSGYKRWDTIKQKRQQKRIYILRKTRNVW